MPVPLPPSPLPRPNLRTIPTGTELHRVHARQFRGDAFNPGLGAPTRFAPLHDRDGRPIPTLYAASTFEAALFETVFHDIPAGASLKTVPRLLLASRTHSVLTVAHPLRLAELRAPDLHLWGLGRDDLVSASPSDYAATARWALAVHASFPEVDGLLWASNRCDPADALLLWAPRAERSLALASHRDGASDSSFLAEVRQAARRAGIVITL